MFNTFHIWSTQLSTLQKFEMIPISNNFKKKIIIKIFKIKYATFWTIRILSEHSRKYFNTLVKKRGISVTYSFYSILGHY